MSNAEKIRPSDGNAAVFGNTKKTVLIVEDDRTHRSMMDKVLKECEFQTVLAENGLVALSKIDMGQPFDLILMDWDMPELNGLETVREIRIRETRDGAHHIPVIAFTSNREPGDREMCLAAGMDAYLPKDVWMPNWRATLIDSLQGLIAGTFRLTDFNDSAYEAEAKEDQQKTFNLDAFDMQSLEQSAALLKDELAIAVEEYLEDAAAYIRDIREGLESRNAEKAARGSHPLKSNSKGFGLVAVSQIAEAINKTTREGSLEGVDSLLSQLQDAFHRAEKKLHDFIRCAGY